MAYVRCVRACCRYVGCAPLLELLHCHAPPRAAPRAIVLGCGLSALPEALAAAGYAPVRAVDTSDVAIQARSHPGGGPRLADSLTRERAFSFQRMRQLQGDGGDARARVSYEVADVRATGWPPACADVAVDKATLDTLLNGADAGADAGSMLREAARLLRAPGGVLLCVSSGAPRERLALLTTGRVEEAPAADDGDADDDRLCEAARAPLGATDEAPPLFELLEHAPLRRGALTFHAYVLRRCADVQHSRA